MIQKLLILVAGLSVGINAFAAYDFKVDGIYYNITSSTEVTVTSNGKYPYSGNVVIPEQVTHDGNTYSVTSIGDNAFTYCSGLTSVTIGDSVTTIGERAFYNCSDLTSVSIGNSVTSIGFYAFHRCSGLTSVTIGNSVTSIGDYAFEYCEEIVSIDISNVISIGKGIFRDCTALESVTLPDGITTIVDSMFWNCTSLIFEIPDTVTTIGDQAFIGCSFTSITIPDSVTTIGSGAFVSCSNLTSVTLPENSQFTTISDSLFIYCRSLASITISDSVTLDKQSVAAILGVPPYVVGAAGYDQQEWNHFISTTVMPIVRGLEQELTRKLLHSPDMYISMNPWALYAYDLKDLSEIGSNLFVRGMMTGNEVRGWLHLPPKEGLDELVILENYIPLGMIGEQKKLLQEAGEEDET